MWLVSSFKTSTKRIFYGWWVVGACFFIGLFGHGILSYCFTSFIEPIAGEFGWSYAQISFAVSIRGVEIGIAAPVMGWLIDRWGSRRTVFGGSIIACLGLLLLSQTKDLPVFYVAFILIGIGTTSFTMSAITIIIASWFRKRIGIATGIATSGIGVSGLFVPVITHIIQLYGWRSAVLAILFSILIIVLPLSFLLRHKPEQYGLLPDGQMLNQRTAEDIVSDKKLEDSDLSLKQAIGSNIFWRLALVSGCLLFILIAVTTHVMPYLSSINIDRYTASLVASSLPLISIVGRISLGWFGDRFDKRLVTAATYIMIALAMLCFEFAGTVSAWLIIPFSILFAVGYGGGATMSGPLTRVFFGRSNFGSIFGLILGITQIGSIVGATLAGWVYDNWGSYQWFWLSTAGIAFLASIIIMTISPTPSKK